MKDRFIVAILVVITASLTESAQDAFFNGSEQRVRSTMAQQPPLPVPLAPTSNVTQLFRYDIVRQITPTRTDTWNYGFSKGLNLIPWYNTEVDINIPPYIPRRSVIILCSFTEWPCRSGL